MKLIFILTRIALGGLMLFSGLNKFFAFAELPAFEGNAQAFMDILGQSQFLDVIGGLEVLGGLFLVTGFFVSLGVVLLGPVVVNILLFHGLIQSNWFEPMSLAATVLFLVTLIGVLPDFAPIFRPTKEVSE